MIPLLKTVRWDFTCPCGHKYGTPDNPSDFGRVGCPCGRVLEVRVREDQVAGEGEEEYEAVIVEKVPALDWRILMDGVPFCCAKRDFQKEARFIDDHPDILFFCSSNSGDNPHLDELRELYPKAMFTLEDGMCQEWMNGQD